MSVTIKPIVSHESYEVNGKEIYKNANGDYMAKQEFTSNELKAFENYRKAVINNPRFKTHTKAEYKG